MNMAAVLFKDNVIKMIDMAGQVTAILNKHKYTSMCWSSKGKQIACGTDTGELYQIDPTGALKKRHAPNPDNEGHRGNDRL